MVKERFIALHIITDRIKPEEPSSAPATMSSLLSRANPIALADNPALVNEDPEEDGWFFKLTLSDPDELSSLMDEAKYADYVSKL